MNYDVSYDTGDKSIQCGRVNDTFKLWLTWKAKVLHRSFCDGMLMLVNNGAPHCTIESCAFITTCYQKLFVTCCRVPKGLLNILTTLLLWQGIWAWSHSGWG